MGEMLYELKDVKLHLKKKPPWIVFGDEFVLSGFWVPSGKKYTVNFLLRFTDPERKTEGIPVTLINRKEEFYSTSFSEEGRARIEVPEGEYYIKFWKIQFPPERKKAGRKAGVFPLMEGMDVEEIERAVNRILSLKEPEEEGRVESAELWPWYISLRVNVEKGGVYRFYLKGKGDVVYLGKKKCKTGRNEIEFDVSYMRYFQRKPSFGEIPTGLVRMLSEKEKIWNL
ncbi:hypothetical protein DRQ18_01575 [bacterium]|nr:MAG: hypothetical protein DRQ18_01575 [bacterium]